MRYLFLCSFLSFVSCAPSSVLDSTNNGDCYILVGRLHIKDVTTSKQFNTIGINGGKDIFPDKFSCFYFKSSADTCVITKISRYGIEAYWNVKSLKKNCVNYIGDLEVVISPKRKKVWLSELNYSSDTKDVILRSEELCGKESNYHKWYEEGGYNYETWDNVLKQGYYLSNPKVISEDEILKFEVKDKFEEVTTYLKSKSKNSLKFSKSLVTYNK
ncbi:hypothetical protein [uncultured Acetobacteroides sp.]|uniref:hypothetical protein n=1 Tax=uncultured Acetobacteroides sp. TaxID=1760811 RepID=UPI0029F4CD89|nr:hypothetical protein [uncultured Acetobacteroides sp.]